MRRLLVYSFFLIPFLVFTALSLFAIQKKSLSIDEHPHLAAGYSYWKTHHVFLNPEHPPLFKWIAAWPMAKAVHVAPEKISGWAEGDQGKFSDTLLYDQSIDVDRVAFLGRCANFIFGLLSLLMVGVLSHRLWGTLGAWLSMMLFALCPNFLAHAPLIHNDVAITFGFLSFSLFAHLFLQRASYARAMGFALALGLALSIKFSAILLLPIYVVVCAVALRKKLLNAHLQDLLQIGILVVVPYLWVSLTYLKPFDISDYFFGLTQVYRNHTQNYSYFMRGEFRSTGFWLYYPFAIAVKTPLVSLAFFAISLWFVRRKQIQLLMVLIAPALLLILSGMVAKHNIGVRHMLPCLGVMYVMGGGVVSTLRTRLGAILGIAVVAVLVIQNRKIYPDYLAFFNAAAGGPKNGINLLDDSNLDWGMDLKQLPAVLQKHHISSIGLDFFGRERPQYRHLPSHPLHVFDRYFPEGDQVVSAQWLRRNALIPVVPHYAYNWLEKYQPTEIIGYSLYLYRFRLAERTEFREGVQWISRETWKAEGLSRLEKLMVENPKFYSGWIALAQANLLFGFGDLAEAALQKAENLHPVNPQEPRQLLEEFRVQHHL